MLGVFQLLWLIAKRLNFIKSVHSALSRDKGSSCSHFAEEKPETPRHKFKIHCAPTFVIWLLIRQPDDVDFGFEIVIRTIITCLVAFVMSLIDPVVWKLEVQAFEPCLSARLQNCLHV